MKSDPGIVLVRRFGMGCAVYVLLSAAGVLLSESGRIPVPQSFFHSTQLVAVHLGAIASACYLWLARKHPTRGTESSASRKPGTEPPWARPAMATILILSSAWIGFVLFVIATLDLDPSF